VAFSTSLGIMAALDQAAQFSWQLPKLQQQLLYYLRRKSRSLHRSSTTTHAAVICCRIIDMISLVLQLRLHFPTVDSCSLDNREMQTVVADLDGTLLRSSSSFLYFILIAFEAGSPLRALLLLLISPLVYIFYHFISEAAGISLLIFVSCAGLKVSAIESVARAVLPEFYLEDMHRATPFWKFSNKFVTANFSTHFLFQNFVAFSTSL